MWGEGQTCQVHSSITCHLLLQERMVESSKCCQWERPPGSQLLPFPPKSAAAPLTQPQQPFLQLSALPQQTGQGSSQELPPSSLWGRRVPAAPSMALACPHQVLLQKHLGTAGDPALLSTGDLLSPCPTTEAALHQQGWKEDAPSAKGTPGWPRAPGSSPRL